MFSFENEKNSKKLRARYRVLAEKYEEKGDRHFQLGQWLNAKCEYMKAYNIIAKELIHHDDNDYRNLARCCFKANKYYLRVEPRNSITGIKEKALKGFACTLKLLESISEPLTGNDSRMMAACHNLLGKCYKKNIHSERVEHAYFSFQALKRIQLLYYTQEDARTLITQFNIYIKEFPTVEKELLFKDYYHVIEAIKKIDRPRKQDYPLFANVYKHMGLAYIKRHYKKEALNCFFLMFDCLRQDSKLKLRTLELYFRSARCAFTPGSIEHEIFSCATLMFSSPLKITEESRLRLFQTVMCCLVERIIHSPHHEACYKNGLQFLEMLRDYGKTALFPDGVFKNEFKKEINFVRLSMQIEVLQQRIILKKFGFFHEKAIKKEDSTPRSQPNFSIFPFLRRCC